MKIVIAGGSGFIGRTLTDFLVHEGHKVVILSRSVKKGTENIRYVQWLHPGAKPEKEIGSADAFVNLAGVSINAGRWSSEHQQQIYDSRMNATDELLRIISTLSTKPSVLVNGSAIGIYPASEDTIYTESATAIADDFLAKTVADWERKAGMVSFPETRAVFMRFGVVLGKGDGALPPMVLPYKLFAGGKVGSGRQWISWMHIQDVVRAIVFAIENVHLQGPVNTTSPYPKRMNEFGKTIGAVLHRPHWLPVPSFAMKLALGQKSALVLQGQHVLPRKLLDSGFEFTFPTLESALKNILIDDV
ncbi:TIGR01777 family oxidoreductase [Sporosarcina sp. NPDC096371]|uniref:TIGR01777 family oxidoreductase n=1 Tax=Sporosarcina sp. NPDC096371 TaxID=3364530 RepID=UPI0037F4B577